MSIKIFYPKRVLNYDPAKPLEGQLIGNQKIVIEYTQEDPAINKFVDEIERLCDKGNGMSLNINLVHNNFLSGARLKKRIEKISEDTNVNTLIRMMVTGYSEADKKLQQIQAICTEGNCRVKQKA